MHPQAALAIHAANHVPQWGFDAAIRYALKRGCHPRLLALALALSQES